MKSMTTINEARTPIGIPTIPTRNETWRDASRPRCRCAKSVAASDSSRGHEISDLVHDGLAAAQQRDELRVVREIVDRREELVVCRIDRRWFTSTRSSPPSCRG